MNTVPLPEHDIGTVQMSDATSSVRCPWKERIGGGGVTIEPASLDSPLDYIRQSAKENDIEVTYEPLYDMFSGSINMALRIEKGYTQVKMQMLTGIDQSDYSKIESGKRYYTFEQCRRIAIALGTSMDYLAELTDEKKPYPRSK